MLKCQQTQFSHFLQQPDLSLPVLGVCCWLFWQHHTVFAEDSQDVERACGSIFILTTTRGQESQSQTLLIICGKQNLCALMPVFLFLISNMLLFLANISTRKKFQTEKYAETAMNQSLNIVRFQTYYGLLKNYSDATSLSLQIAICALPSDKTDLRIATA